ncbi:GspE/PulE family protein [Fontivita pretiosa]|jgi:type II secretory ATPase GspE/PulE/Tfp pilus assembly ATPase PilB-like protein|uniref:GspE/PulE family protein n=1 Tax=Fontivita pretiosa TaxID=2989684 RepID=UPI003D184F2B
MPNEFIRPVRNELSTSFRQELLRQEAEALAETAESTNLLASRLLADALRHHASDIHLDPQGQSSRIRFRIDGDLLDVAILSRAQGGRLLRHFKAISGLDSADRFRPADSRLTQIVDGREIDLRIAALPSVAGEKLSIRLLDRSRVLQHLDELGFTDEQRDKIEQWLKNICGMFLVAGPTGSGKTTTLYAILHELRLRDRCVVTIEDPVEYSIEGIVQTQVDRRHDLSFAQGLRGMLRADPDYLLLGEIRDAEAADAAMEASGSGRVLMSTIHAPDAISAITALRNFGLADHQIASSLRMVVAQRLVKRLCRRCRKQRSLEESERQLLQSLGLPATAQQTWTATGCVDCRYLGYDGRIGVFEVWRLVDADYDAILHHADERALRAGATSRGLRSLAHDGWLKVEQGITSIEEWRTLSGTYSFA